MNAYSTMRTTFHEDGTLDEYVGSGGYVPAEGWERAHFFDDDPWKVVAFLENASEFPGYVTEVDGVKADFVVELGDKFSLPAAAKALEAIDANLRFKRKRFDYFGLLLLIWEER